MKLYQVDVDSGMPSPRFADLYVVPPLQVLFGRIDPNARDAELVGELAERFRRS